MSSHTVKEQLLYELGDPQNYITPDCVADFTIIHLEETGADRVRVSGIRGGPRPPTLKLSISYTNGWKAIGTLVYSWPQALEKARAADRIVRQRLADLGLNFDEIYTEFFGVNACLGPAAPANPDPPEVQVRIGVRGADKQGRGPLHARVDSAGAERSARRHGIRRGPAAGTRDRGVLAGAGAARGDRHARRGGGVMEEELEDLTDYSEDGVDLTLVRWFLSLTPVERLQYVQRRANEVVAIRRLNGIE